jgi:hypothetical protein
MGWPVAWLKRMIDADEFDRWCEYYRRRPFDDESVHQTHLAQLTSIYVNANRGDDTPPTRPADFLLYRAPEPEKTGDDLDAMLDAKFRAYFSRDLNNEADPA